LGLFFGFIVQGGAMQALFFKLDQLALIGLANNVKARAILMAAGAMLTLALPPLYIFPLAFLVFPFLIRTIDYAHSKKAAFMAGWWFGFGHFASAFYWVGNSFLMQDSVPNWLAPFAVAALAGALALYPALLLLLCRWHWPQGAGRIILFAALWAVFEWLRGTLLTGFPWNLLAHVWGFSEAMMQVVSVVGSYGLSLFSVIIFSAPLWLAISDDRSTRLALMAAALLIGIGAFGFWRIASLPVAHHDGLLIRLVQANIPQNEKWVRENWDRNIIRHIALSNSPLAAGADGSEGSGEPENIIVIWPETAVPYSIGTTEGLAEILARQLEGNVTLFTGAPRRDRSSGTLRLYNSLHGISADGELLFTYDKSHLVPFGEYVPLRGLLSAIGLGKIVPGETDFSAGPGPMAISIEGIPAFSPLICYEIIFPGNVRPNGEVEWLLNITNDAWFGDSSGPRQHLVIARFRAVEEGLPVVRSTGSGISAIIDPLGGIEAYLGLDVEGVVDGALPMAIQGSTTYHRWGDRIFFSFIAGLLALVLGLPLTRKGRDRH
jgi:apolipoprotein N-acyltransferase